jgi:hypothetical protein
MEACPEPFGYAQESLVERHLWPANSFTHSIFRINAIDSGKNGKLLEPWV